jgi:transcriptional regulator with XRE-family HTH domain
MTAPKSPIAADVEIGKRIATLRAARGMSQTALGSKLGVSFQQVQKYEAGVNRISAGRLISVADALGCSASDLLGAFTAAAPYDIFHGHLVPELLAAFSRINDHSSRSGVLRIVTSIAELHPDRE